MYITLILCRAGITFEAVHDSFWTHACFVDIMNKVESYLVVQSTTVDWEIFV